ncbi:MAG TPA: cation:proton antiporter [Armatimonadota bacterium]|jgi:CPA2 family monovalent cation:H+ antiporter-2
MEDPGFLREVAVVLIAALVGGALAHLLRLPLLVGYLLTGIAVGPHTPGLIADEHTVNMIANLGVVLLMFAVGVQFSLGELAEARVASLLGGGLQIVTTLLLGVGVGMTLGWSAYGGLFLGCALALSSTAVMMRILEERGELSTQHGTLMLGIGVVQDLSLVLMVAVLPAVATLSLSVSALAGVGLALGRAALFLGVLFLLAVSVVPALMDRVVRTGSRELLLLAVVGLSLSAAAVAEVAGLSLALGAFLAGLMLSESPYSHDVLQLIRPLRDVFASLFFVAVGMLLDPGFVVRHWVAVAAVVSAVLVGKPLLTLLALLPSRLPKRTLVMTSLGLAQTGEFSFVLATYGTSRGLIPQEIGSVILASALLTLLAAPFLFQLGAALHPEVPREPGESPAEAPGADLHQSRPAALVLGCGRIGHLVSDALRAQGVSQLVVDLDPHAAAQRRERGVPVLLGDASQPQVLAQAVAPETRLAVVALPDAAAAGMAIRRLRELKPDLAIIARVHRGVDADALRRLGADAVIHAEFEAGAEMVRQGLLHLGIGENEVGSYVDALRERRYALPAA